MRAVEHKQPWRGLTADERRARARVLSDVEVRRLVQAVRKEQREKATARWFGGVWLLLAGVLSWLAFTESGARFLRWLDQ